MSPPVPPSVFSIPFGLAGLTTAWVYAGRRDLVPDVIGDVLAALGALVWLVAFAAYARSVAQRGFSTVARDLRDPVVGSFTALIPVSALLLVIDGLVPHAPDLGRVVVDVLIVVVVLLAGWSTGQWMHGTLEFTALHPGYFLPSVAGGLLASVGAASVGQTRLAEVLFGLGVIAWLLLGSMILARLFFGPPLPPALMPTRAIQVAPAAVATLAYLAIYGERIDAVVAGLAGYGLLMVIAQLRLVPAFLALDFGLSFWSFTFSWAAVASVGLHWLAIEQPDGWKALSFLLLAAVTALVGVIAARTVVAAAARTLLPPAPVPVAAHA